MSFKTNYIVTYQVLQCPVKHCRKLEKKGIFDDDAPYKTDIELLKKRQ